MDIKTCRFCRKAFRGFSALCPHCVEQLDNKYIIVRNYLDKNKGSNLSQVADDTGIDEKSLLFLVREGRIAVRGGDSPITCLKCGTPISSGKYCEKCKGGLVKQFESTVGTESAAKPAQTRHEKPVESKSRIHILKDD